MGFMNCWAKAGLTMKNNKLSPGGLKRKLPTANNEVYVKIMRIIRVISL